MKDLAHGIREKLHILLKHDEKKILILTKGI